METYKVSIHSGVREMETRILQKREPAGDEVLLKVTSCAICTLEQRIWKGVIAQVNGEKCVGCRKCAKECPASAILVTEREVQQ